MSIENLHRLVRLYGEINQPTALQAIEELLCLDQQSPEEPITMHVSSPGGCVINGFALIDVMRHVQAPIDIVGIGMVASMAAFIFVSGDKGRRHLLPHARVMLHGLKGGTQGPTATMRSHVDLQVGFEREMEMHLSELIGRSLPAIRSLLAREEFLTPSEVIALNLADHILEEIR